MKTNHTMRLLAVAALALPLVLTPSVVAQPARGGGAPPVERPARPDLGAGRDGNSGRGGDRERPMDRDRIADRIGDREGRPGMPQDPAQRRMIEQRLRERFGEVVRRQLALDDNQFRRLRETNREFEGQRRSLAERERGARMSIRSELDRGDAADDAKVSAQMQELLKVQRERLSLAEQEDAKLSEFLSPAQRAKYFGLQDQLRRRVEEMRRRAMMGDALPPE
ncbi:MAG: hypothetical protein SFW08_14825 [Gemmatimonadaceae bacterium]|nr:hypothetical protein [Gemmatimonadaceae bacterium]